MCRGHRRCSSTADHWQRCAALLPAQARFPGGKLTVLRAALPLQVRRGGGMQQAAGRVPGVCPLCRRRGGGVRQAGSPLQTGAPCRQLAEPARLLLRIGCCRCCSHAACFWRCTANVAAAAAAGAAQPLRLPCAARAWTGPQSAALLIHASALQCLRCRCPSSTRGRRCPFNIGRGIPKSAAAAAGAPGAASDQAAGAAAAAGRAPAMAAAMAAAPAPASAASAAAAVTVGGPLALRLAAAGQLW